VAIPPRSLHASMVLCHHFHWYEEKLYSRYSHDYFPFHRFTGSKPSTLSAYNVELYLLWNKLRCFLWAC